MAKRRIVIPCGRGIAAFLKAELERLGFPILREGPSSVETEGTMEDAMALNLLIRTGQRILLLLAEFECREPKELYEKIKRIRWEDFLLPSAYLTLTASVHTPSIRDSRFASLKGKDAIVDRLRELWGRRPDTGPEKREAVVHLYWQGTWCRIFLDTSGEVLSRRGYRKAAVEAPLQETLAAALVMATNWEGGGNFVNPMCGSGTLAIEAALIALRKAPGLLRSDFGFMHLRGFQETLWKEVRKRTRALSKRSFEGRIVATDVDADALRCAEQNAQTAGVRHLIDFHRCDFRETPLPEGPGVILINPPYGKRMGEKKELEETYRGIGDFFKKRCQGYRGFVFTGNLDLAKRVGLRTKRRILFYNGEIECRLLEYELYEGSRKQRPFLSASA